MKSKHLWVISPVMLRGYDLFIVFNSESYKSPTYSSIIKGHPFMFFNTQKNIVIDRYSRNEVCIRYYFNNDPTDYNEYRAKRLSTFEGLAQYDYLKWAKKSKSLSEAMAHVLPIC